MTFLRLNKDIMQSIVKMKMHVNKMENWSDIQMQIKSYLSLELYHIVDAI